MSTRIVRTSIEKIRRRDLVEAAYLTFLEHGMQGMTMARIGERAGMSHGIVNYYFRSKDELLAAVMRKSLFSIMAETLRRLRLAVTPRERVSAIVAGNFPPEIFTLEIARAWLSYYAMMGQHPEFDRVQRVSDGRLASNLNHALKQLTCERHALDLGLSIAIMIDGAWLRHARSNDTMDAASAVRHIEDFVDGRLSADPTRPAMAASRT
jgi:TetR/AcrR family transcriptional repressor of bet genes